jgi:cell division transport system ATP-binding protein
VQEVQRQTESLEPLTAEMIASMRAARSTEPAPAAETKPADTSAIVLPDIDVAELGVADRLGLSDRRDDEEVGPTS